MTTPKTAMILAAGLGVRMRPLTDDRPKALVEVSGKALIGHLLDRLEDAGVEKIVVNLHYKPEPLAKYLSAHPRSEKIILSHESGQILETGGGVRKALTHFAGDPFYVANCDAYFPDTGDNPFQTLGQNWRKDMAALLLIKETGEALGYSGPGDFFQSPDGHLQRRGDKGQAPFTFTGLQILTPSLFEDIAEEVFSLNKIYDRALAAHALFGVAYGGPWRHMGTPEMVAAAEGYPS